MSHWRDPDLTAWIRADDGWSNQVSQLYAALERGDRETLARLLAPAAVLMTAWSSMLDIAALAPPSPAASLKVRGLRVLRHGDEMVVLSRIAVRHGALAGDAIATDVWGPYAQEWRLRLHHSAWADSSPRGGAD